MPAALIEVRRPYTETDEVAMLDAVQGALVAAFRIPPEDRNIRLIAHEPHRFACSPRLADPERFTLVSIACFAGRSVDAKRRLYAEIVERLSPFGIPRDHIMITVRDIPAESWGIRGGQAACDVDLGFEVRT